MSVISGNKGAVNGAAQIGNWSVTSTADLQAFVASGSKQGTVRSDGIKKWNGQYMGKETTPPVMPGVSFTFTGSFEGTNGATGTAVVDQVEIVIDIETGTVIQYTTQFSAAGALTLGAAAATDTTVPTPKTSVGRKVEINTTTGVTPVWSNILNTKAITITITAANAKYSDSETSGEEWTLPGGNIDFQVSIPVNVEDDLANLPAVNSFAEIRAYVNATTFWHLRWVKWGEQSDIRVDIDTNEMIGCTLNGSMSGSESWTDDGVPAAQVLGFIKNPAAATFWPV